MRERRRLLPLIAAACLWAASSPMAPAGAVPAAGEGAGAAPSSRGGSGPGLARALEGGAAPTAAEGPGSAGAWIWPVRGPVIRPFDPPEDPYGAGHRGIDIAAPPGTMVLAPADGVVTFAGQVGGHLFLTLDHGGGLRSMCSWVSELSVRAGEVVRAGQAIARTGWGHPGSPVPHLHFGVRLGDAYVDPLGYLGPLSLVGLIRLAPLAE
ncbi:MAG TPA: M23 family metallopeptidase, partial [Actinomycetota bacterium]|nr:M23 family metallopeptidase [Actinomycetota bacterium]